jgi:hypothetical protein
LSTSEQDHDGAGFDRWIVQEFGRRDAFTCFVVLVEIKGVNVAPLCSTYLNVIGDETRWDEIVVMFHGAGVAWDGAAFFPTPDDEGLLDNPTARVRLRLLEQRIDGDRLVLNEGAFFDKHGRRMRIDEVAS